MFVGLNCTFIVSPKGHDALVPGFITLRFLWYFLKSECLLSVVYLKKDSAGSSESKYVSCFPIALSDIFAASPIPIYCLHIFNIHFPHINVTCLFHLFQFSSRLLCFINESLHTLFGILHRLDIEEVVIGSTNLGEDCRQLSLQILLFASEDHNISLNNHSHKL